jgi:hypothetical protein
MVHGVRREKFFIIFTFFAKLSGGTKILLRRLDWRPARKTQRLLQATSNQGGSKMGLRSAYVRPLSWRHPRLKQRVTHRFCCRECGERFIALRDDARFCSNGCKQANYRRRGAVSAKK